MEKKPSNISVKDWLITNTSKQYIISEDIVSEVISWSFENANKATKTSSEIEISGFGTFLVSKNKTNKRINKLSAIYSKLILKEPSESRDKKIENIEKEIEYLKTKNNDI